MSKRIELTDTEREAAAEAAYIAHEMAVRGDGKYVPWAKQDWSHPKWRSSIDAAVAAANRVRAGDPLGTVRRNPKTGEVAVRALFHCSLLDCKNCEPQPSWHWIDEKGVQRHARTDDSMSAKDIEGWPVIYTSEADQ